MSTPSPVVTEEVRFPIGDFRIDPDVTPAKRRRWIQQMGEAPARLADAVRGLDDEQMDTPYREGGWTPRQVVHHLTDAHINGYVRFKLAVTEDRPPIKTYEEDLWAETADARAPVEVSLRLLAALHERWLILLASLAEEQFVSLAFSHPQRGLMTIDRAIQLYAWHGLHHTAHITTLRARRGW